jgi:hypothetical protein
MAMLEKPWAKFLRMDASVTHAAPIDIPVAGKKAITLADLLVDVKRPWPIIFILMAPFAMSVGAQVVDNLGCSESLKGVILAWRNVTRNVWAVVFRFVPLPYAYKLSAGERDALTLCALSLSAIVGASRVSRSLPHLDRYSSWFGWWNASRKCSGLQRVVARALPTATFLSLLYAFVFANIQDRLASKAGRRIVADEIVLFLFIVSTRLVWAIRLVVKRKKTVQGEAPNPKKTPNFVISMPIAFLLYSFTAAFLKDGYWQSGPEKWVSLGLTLTTCFLFVIAFLRNWLAFGVATLIVSVVVTADRLAVVARPGWLLIKDVLERITQSAWT